MSVVADTTLGTTAELLVAALVEHGVEVLFLNPGTDTAPAVVAVAPRPGTADTTAAWDSVRQAAARRPGRAAEQVVQVQIGRLEVTAAPGAPEKGPRRGAAQRPGAAVSLADYLARGRE